MMKKVLIYLTTFTFILGIVISSIVFASNSIPLSYNIIPDIVNGYVIDSKNQNQITFTLFENESALYFSGEPLEIVDNSFSIDTTSLTGKQEFTITNSLDEVANYTYYFSDENGYVENYRLDELSNLDVNVYVETVNNVKIIYTELEKDTLNDLKELLLSLPEKMLSNTQEIKLLPCEHSSNAAGITRYNKITFYNLSKYSKSTFKNIVIHEIAHTWAFELMKEKAIDYSYTEYKNVVKLDKRFPSNYAKKNVEAGNYSEDFAESISFYIINKTSFSKKYPARAKYIENLINTYLIAD